LQASIFTGKGKRWLEDGGARVAIIAGVNLFGKRKKTPEDAGAEWLICINLPGGGYRCKETKSLVGG
jgi:hypothetical protein